MNRPTKATIAGQAFLALRSKALSAGRTTAEYLRLYALEGFLLRLAHSSHKNRFVLKGGVLLAAYELRRPTADVDLAAVATPSAVEAVATRCRRGRLSAADAWIDGLTFDLDDVPGRNDREGEAYGGSTVGRSSATSSSQPTGEMPRRVPRRSASRDGHRGGPSCS